MDRILAILRAPVEGLILDAGCGMGYHSLRIARKGFRCVGVDLSLRVLLKAQSHIAHAGLNHRVSLACQALEDLPFADETFDAIHCRGVLMHIPEWDKALAQRCRVLKTGGRIALLELNDRSL